MGTQLQKLGLPAGGVPELWTLEHPETLLKLHKQYIDAGADLIETNTFGANYIRLKENKLEARLEEINREAVLTARKASIEAAQDDIIIAGSMGPTGKMIKPLGKLTEKEAFISYKKQVSVLVDSGIDVVLIETMVDINEIEQAVKAVREFEIPVIAQMSFQESLKTVMGVSPEDAVNLFEEYEVDVIGVNCTPGAEKTLPIIAKLNQFTDRPLSVFPNAGSPVMKNNEVKYPEKAEDFKPYIKKFLELNVKVIGGCCGTTPEIIAVLREEVDKYKKQ